MNGKKSKELRKLAYERATVVGKAYVWESHENNKGKSFTNIANRSGTMKSVLNLLKKERSK